MLYNTSCVSESLHQLFALLQLMVVEFAAVVTVKILSDKILCVIDQRKQDGGQDAYSLNHCLPKLQEHLFCLFQQRHHYLKACHALMSHS